MRNFLRPHSQVGFSCPAYDKYQPFIMFTKRYDTQGRMQTSAHVARATVRFCHNYFYFGHPVVYVYFLFCFGYPVDSIPVPQIAKYIYFLVLLLRTTPSTGNFG